MSTTTTHNPLAGDAFAYVEGVSVRSGRALRYGWRDELADRIDAALGRVGTFKCPLHGRLWLDAQANDLMLGVQTEDDE